MAILPSVRYCGGSIALGGSLVSDLADRLDDVFLLRLAADAEAGVLSFTSSIGSIWRFVRYLAHGGSCSSVSPAEPTGGHSIV